ncbi:MAG: late competence development ComFB family protein [Leptolyngbyaceae cyanobacterium bins.59]|nr:late competence development ComFB family protein [Leptolyngbyaceae cyanobacterium bins.59]
MPTERTTTYRNVMESLVAEEVDRQFQQIPPRLARYLSKEEVTAFALNRLPALYATSEKGWRQQVIRGRRDCGTQIATAVRQALVAVQRDPLRMESPLPPAEDNDAHSALRDLRTILKREELTWKDLVDAVEQALVQTARGQVTWQKRNSAPVNRNAWNSELYKR